MQDTVLNTALPRTPGVSGHSLSIIALHLLKRREGSYTSAAESDRQHWPDTGLKGARASFSESIEPLSPARM